MSDFSICAGPGYADSRYDDDPENPQGGGAAWDPTSPAGKQLREEMRLERERNKTNNHQEEGQK